MSRQNRASTTATARPNLALTLFYALALTTALALDQESAPRALLNGSVEGMPFHILMLQEVGAVRGAGWHNVSISVVSPAPGRADDHSAAGLLQWRLGGAVVAPG